MPEKEPRISFHEQIQRNKAKSALLIGIVFIVLLLLGYAISFALDPGYFFIVMIISIIFSMSYIVFGYYNSDKIALASVGAKKADISQYRQLYNSVEGLTLASGMPMPKIYIMESEQTNAFATGRDPQHSVICVTTGALKKLDKQELEGVIAHEMSHVANYDIRFMTFTAIVIGMIAIIAELFLRSLWFSSGSDNKKHPFLIIAGIALSILAPLVANLAALAISRRREFTADATGVKFTRYPKGLASALKKIKHEHLAPNDKHHFSKATAPLFISDPFKKKFTNLFSTHPNIDERIAKLERM